jgi:AraC-like DNA-binding protein/Fe-S-cluster containining protein
MSGGKRKMKTEEELVQTARVLHKALKVDLTVYDGDRNCLVQFTKNPYPEELCGKLCDHPEKMWKQLKKAKEDSVFYRYLPEFHLVCMDLKVVEEDSSYYLSVGPFLTEHYSEQLVLKILHSQKLSLSRKGKYESLYSQFPYFSNRAKSVAEVVLYLIRTCPEWKQIPVIYEETSDQEEQLKETRREREDLLEKTDVLLNYETERRWRTAVEEGDFQMAKRVISQMSKGEFFYRTPDNPLRSQKNLLFTVNTICRIAAVDGGADVVSVHGLSDLFAIRIEQAKSGLETAILEEEMLRAYCQIVMETKTKGHSAPVAKAIQYMYTCFDQPLTMEKIAGAIHFSPGYLSRTFKAEMHVTVGEYLNRLRVEKAAGILRTGDFPVTEVAIMTGFSSYAKFSVEFKKYMGKTAREYVAAIH